MLAPVIVLLLAATTPGEGAAAGADPGAAATAPADPAAQALARKVQAFYERTRDLSARFRQTYTYGGFGRRQVSSGQLLVKKPGMMRWEYQAPSAKTVAVKGRRLVQYEPEENQAYVDEHFDATTMSAALAFLLGRGDLVKEFEVSQSSTGALVLHPREPDPRVASIELVAAADGQIKATRVVDGAGNVNEIAFEVKLPPDVVQIAPPGQ